MGHNFLCYANRILALSDEAMSITHAGEPAGNFALGSMETPPPPACPRCWRLTTSAFLRFLCR